METVAAKRNFRSHYYEKVGYHGVDEKKSINFILNEQKIDKDKLLQFCLRFPIPKLTRLSVWSVLLDVLSPFSRIHESSKRHCLDKFNDLQRWGTVTRRINEDSSKAEIYLQMFLFEESDIRNGTERDKLKQADLDKDDFLAIATSMTMIHDNDSMSYYLTKHFVKHVRKFRDSSLKGFFYQYLRENEFELHERLQKLGILDSLPLSVWFNRCFAGTLHFTSLQRIWDKVICGSSKILVFVAISMLSSWCQDSMTPDPDIMKKPELQTVNRDSAKIDEEQGSKSKKSAELNSYISKLSEDTPEVIVCQAIEMLNESFVARDSSSSNVPRFHSK